MKLGGGKKIFIFRGNCHTGGDFRKFSFLRGERGVRGLPYEVQTPLHNMIAETWNLTKNKFYYTLKLKMEITVSATVSFTDI